MDLGVLGFRGLGFRVLSSHRVFIWSEAVFGLMGYVRSTGFQVQGLGNAGCGISGCESLGRQLPGVSLMVQVPNNPILFLNTNLQNYYP